MGLTINTTSALIGIERTPSRLDIQTQNAQLELKSNKVKVSIMTEQPRVLIDQYEARASAGLKNNHDMVKEAAQRAYQQVLEAIGRKAEDGDILAAIERDGNPIAEIAARDAWPQREYGLDFIPKAGPRFEVTGSVKIEWNVEEIKKGVEGFYRPGRVSINFHPSVVKIYLRQYPSVKVRYTGNRLDTKV